MKSAEDLAKEYVESMPLGDPKKKPIRVVIKTKRVRRALNNSHKSEPRLAGSAASAARGLRRVKLWVIT